MKSEMLQEAMKVKSKKYVLRFTIWDISKRQPFFFAGGVAECMAFVTNYIKRQYEKQSETGLVSYVKVNHKV